MQLVLDHPEKIIPNSTARTTRHYEERFVAKVKEGGHYQLFKYKKKLEPFMPQLTALIHKVNKQTNDHYEIYSFLGIDLEKMAFDIEDTAL
jgi:hypothetical protein